MRPACILDFQQLVSVIRLLWVPTELTPVPGWLTREEERTLYALAYILSGPFLEVGAWVGKSTSIIARAIRDSGQYKKFVTSELNPTLQISGP
jgi:predicted O-methyltransferase YrrM